MADIIGKYNLRPAVKGDTWDGLTITINENITGYTIEMIVEQPGNDTPALELTTTDSDITITDGPGGEFVVEPFNMGLEAGDYDYRIILTDGSGRRKTRIKGTWKIIKP